MNSYFIYIFWAYGISLLGLGFFLIWTGVELRYSKIALEGVSRET